MVLWDGLLLTSSYLRTIEVHQLQLQSYTTVFYIDHNTGLITVAQNTNKNNNEYLTPLLMLLPIKVRLPSSKHYANFSVDCREIDVYHDNQCTWMNEFKTDTMCVYIPTPLSVEGFSFFYV